ncbi:MAG: carbohydrate ABC transporter permease [Anaerolineae bacterium]
MVSNRIISGEPGERRLGRRIVFSPYLMVVPALLLVALFTLYPYGYAIWSSLQVLSPILPPSFAGLKNYQAVITSTYFFDALRNTLVFTGISVPIIVALGVLVASLLNQRFFGDVALKASVLLPWAIPAAITGVIWKGVFSDSWGALNAILYSLGFIPDYVKWLTTRHLATTAVIVAHVWMQFPMAAIFSLAAMQAIPEELYEAAAIDGAGTLQRFFSITLPNIKVMLVIVTLFEILMSLNTFDLTYGLTGGGPGTSTMFISYFIWAEFFKMLSYGKGAALAVILAAVALVIIFIILNLIPGEALLGGEEE